MTELCLMRKFGAGCRGPVGKVPPWALAWLFPWFAWVVVILCICVCFQENGWEGLRSP